MQRFQAAGATGAMSGALWYATAMLLKLPKPYWKPALFGFLGEFVVHMNSDPPSVAIDEQSGKVDAWWLPSQIGYWGKGGVRLYDRTKDGDSSPREGFMQAIISAVISGVVWYVVARGFFGGGHKVAIWYAGIAAVTAGYGGYLKGDDKGGYRLPGAGGKVARFSS